MASAAAEESGFDPVFASDDNSNTHPSIFQPLHRLWRTIVMDLQLSSKNGAFTSNMGVDYIVSFNFESAEGTSSPSAHG
jgi:hypothetical protein